MGGISGFCSFQHKYLADENKWRKVSKDMKNSIAHRGSAYYAEFHNENVWMAQGADSAISFETNGVNTGEGHSFLVMDGYVYNPEELPEGKTDAQKVLHLLIKDGIQGIDKINGGFAGAYYCATSKKLYLFRDHVGVKPLFFTIADGCLVFASEIKGLLAHPQVAPVIDKKGLGEVFGLGPARYEKSGVFKEIYSIMPGHMAIFDQAGFRQIQYWGLQADTHKETFEETAEHVAFLLTDAVKRQMQGVSDICTFLSGGVDSSLVTAIAARALNGPLTTYSFDFKDNDKNFVSNSFQPEQDRPYVEQMAAYFNTDHSYLFCDTGDLLHYMEKAVVARDLPGMCDVDASLLYFCKQVSSRNKTAMAGECADEIFAGYPWFHRPELYNSDRFPWSNNPDARKVLLKDDVIETIGIDNVMSNYYDLTQQMAPVLDGEAEEQEKKRRISFLTIKWFMATLGDRMDRMSAQAGMDVRMPFADKRLVGYLYNVPWQLKTKDGVVKGLLREGMKGYLPENLLYRKKSPYPKTYNPEYEKQLSMQLMDVLKNQKGPITQLVDLEKAEKFIQTPSDYGKPWYGQLMAGPQMLAYMLQINYWIKQYQIRLEV